MELSNSKSGKEHARLEQEIQILSREVKEHQKTAAGEITDKAALTAVLQKRSDAAAAPPPSSAPTDQSPSVLPAYLQKESPENKLKIEELVDKAFHKGIDAALREARNYGPFFLDAYHDTLTSRLYEELKARKLL